MSVVRHWNKSSKGAVDTLSLEVFKDRLDEIFEQLHLVKDAHGRADVPVREVGTR